MRKILIGWLLFIISIPLQAQLNKQDFSFSGTGNLTLPLGRYQIGTALHIISQVAGGWAEHGGIYHIVGGWNAQPKIIYRGETGQDGRLKFYSYVDPSNIGYMYLFATWENQSPSKQYSNTAKLSISSAGAIEPNNLGVFSNAQLIESLSGITDLQVQDTRYISTSPSSYTKVLQPHFKYYNAIGLPNVGSGYSTLLGLRGWTSDNSGGKAYELAFSDDNQIRFRSGYSPSWEAWRRIIIEENNGNVGIGTTAPRALLDVGNPVNNTLTAVLGRMPEGNNIGEGTYLGIRTYTTQPGPAHSFSIEHKFYGEVNNAINFWRGGDVLGGYMTFATSNGSERMRIDPAGNVGIATTDTKGYKLAVNGPAIFTKAVVKNYGNWPDYVFEPAYQLPSLDSVSAFIKENKHLPEMPSAATVEKDGHDLGEVQKLLLKKVEELTLYVIEQRKQIMELKKENELIKNRIK